MMAGMKIQLVCMILLAFSSWSLCSGKLSCISQLPEVISFSIFTVCCHLTLMYPGRRVSPLFWISFLVIEAGYFLSLFYDYKNWKISFSFLNLQGNKRDFNETLHVPLCNVTTRKKTCETNQAGHSLMRSTGVVPVKVQTHN